MNIEVLKNNISRFDTYIEKADNKASFNLALAGAILIAILSSSCEEKFNVALICLGGSILLSTLVLVPRKSKEEFNSCLYYKSVAKMDYEQYRDGINELDEDKYKKELLVESKELAKICEKKMIINRFSLICSYISIVNIVSIHIGQQVNNILFEVGSAVCALIIYILICRVTGQKKNSNEENEFLCNS